MTRPHDLVLPDLPASAQGDAARGLPPRGGLCAETAPELFFPPVGGSVELAKGVCRRCEVREECREYALSHADGFGEFGVWGGLSEAERRALTRWRSS